MAEWLRRLTRNQLCSARTGSNPVGSDYFFFFFVNDLFIENMTFTGEQTQVNMKMHICTLNSELREVQGQR